MTENEIGPVIQPHELGPVDREQFACAFELANNVGSQVIPAEDPGRFGVTLVDVELGEITQIRFSDQPINRAIFALKKKCGGDSETYFNVTMRFYAMLTILKCDEVTSWMMEDKTRSGCVQLDTAVVYAGAEADLDKDGEFNIPEFFDRVESIDQELDVSG